MRQNRDQSMKIELAGQAPERVATLGHVLPAVFFHTIEGRESGNMAYNTIITPQNAYGHKHAQSSYTDTQTDTEYTHVVQREKSTNRKKEKEIPSGYLTVCHGKIHHFQQVNPGKPSISMGHLYHGYVK